MDALLYKHDNESKTGRYGTVEFLHPVALKQFIK